MKQNGLRSTATSCVDLNHPVDRVCNVSKLTSAWTSFTFWLYVLLQFSKSSFRLLALFSFSFTIQFWYPGFCHSFSVLSHRGLSSFLPFQLVARRRFYTADSYWKHLQHHFLAFCLKLFNTSSALIASETGLLRRPKPFPVHFQPCFIYWRKADIFS